MYISVQLFKTMKKMQTISATKARNNFFTLLEESFLQNQPFIIKKSNIPLAYLIPVSKEDKTEESDRIKELLQITGQWFDLKDHKKVRKDVDQRLTKYESSS